MAARSTPNGGGREDPPLTVGISGRDGSTTPGDADPWAYVAEQLEWDQLQVAPEAPPVPLPPADLLIDPWALAAPSAAADRAQEVATVLPEAEGGRHEVPHLDSSVSASSLSGSPTPVPEIDPFYQTIPAHETELLQRDNGVIGSDADPWARFAEPFVGYVLPVAAAAAPEHPSTSDSQLAAGPLQDDSSAAAAYVPALAFAPTPTLVCAPTPTPAAIAPPVAAVLTTATTEPDPLVYPAVDSLSQTTHPGEPQEAAHRADERPSVSLVPSEPPLASVAALPEEPAAPSPAPPPTSPSVPIRVAASALVSEAAQVAQQSVQLGKAVIRQFLGRGRRTHKADSQPAAKSK